MISFGNNIRNTQEPLQQIEVATLYDMIRNPQPELVETIKKLRLIRSIDGKKYSSQKTMLPFFVCSKFEPMARKTENFAYSEYFVVDIDHLSSQDILLSDLKIRLKKDPRVMMCFTSPSMDGVKVMFRLKDRCYDPGEYKLFYRLFAEKMAKDYSLEKNLDSCTCDVTRACFLSVDLTAYFNPDAEPVDISDYLPTEDTQSMWDSLRKVEKEESQYVQEETVYHDPDEETMSNIRAILNPEGRQPKPKKLVFVPEILNDVIGSLEKYITSTGLEVSEVIDIQYGKKIRMQLSRRSAEVNLFYGKRGFTAVESPRTGTDPELNGMCAELIQGFVDAA